MASLENAQMRYSEWVRRYLGRTSQNNVSPNSLENDINVITSGLLEPVIGSPSPSLVLELQVSYKGEREKMTMKAWENCSGGHVKVQKWCSSIHPHFLAHHTPAVVLFF